MSDQLSRNSATVARDQRKTARMGRGTAIISAVAGLLTLSTAVFGFLFGSAHVQNRDLSASISQKNATIGQLQTQVDQDRGTIEAHQSTIEDQAEQIRELERLVPAAIDDEDAPDVRSSGRVRVASGGDTLDLNSTDLNWGARPTWFVGSDGLEYDGEDIRVGALSYVEISEAASFATCAVASGYDSANSFEPRFLESDHICFRLESGRYASVVVEGVSSQFVDLAITVWELP